MSPYRKQANLPDYSEPEPVIPKRRNIELFVCYLILAQAVVSGWLAGCSSPAQRTLTAVEIAEVTLPYQYALDVCRENARAAKSWAVYEACEKAESRRVCNERPQLKAAWKRCAEVLP